jgi:hypothetical protein
MGLFACITSRPLGGTSWVALLIAGQVFARNIFFYFGKCNFGTIHTFDTVLNILDTFAIYILLYILVD